MSEQTEKYDEIINNYRSGKLGDTNLSMQSILENVGEEELFDRMSIEDIDYLINNSTGIIKTMFSLIKNKKMIENDKNSVKENVKAKVKELNKPKKI